MAKKKKTMHVSAFTQGGLGSMIKFWRDRMGCEITSPPRERTDGTKVWECEMTKPWDDVPDEPWNGMKYGG